MHKLTADQVRSIRARVAAGERQTDIARELGMNKNHVNDIVLRKVWKET